MFCHSRVFIYYEPARPVFIKQSWQKPTLLMYERNLKQDFEL